MLRKKTEKSRGKETGGSLVNRGRREDGKDERRKGRVKREK